MARFITLTQAIQWDNYKKDDDVLVNVDRITHIEPNWKGEVLVTTIYLAPGVVHVRESMDEVQSLINNHKEKINKYND
jgi:hypothetical protein